VWILWLKELGLEETKENMDESNGSEEFEVKERRRVGFW